MMTHYLVFAGLSYYPRGGFKDIIQTDEPITTIEDALEIAANTSKDWWQVVKVSISIEEELTEFEIIKSGGKL